MKIIGKWAYYAAAPLIRRYFLRRGMLPRTRVWLCNDQGRVLVIKGWFGHQRWSLPGGGIKKGESPAKAASRELREETGISVAASQLKAYANLPSSDNSFTALVFIGHVQGEPLPDLPPGRWIEIIDRRWVDPANLPPDSSPLLQQIAKMHMLADAG